jgi:hypothetical protein
MEDGICKLSGGLTSYPADGLYLAPSGEVQRDRVQVLEVYGAEEKAAAIERELKAIAASLAIELDQESIALSVGGEMNFIGSRLQP